MKTLLLYKSNLCVQKQGNTTIGVRSPRHQESKKSECNLQCSQILEFYEKPIKLVYTCSADASYKHWILHIMEETQISGFTDIQSSTRLMLHASVYRPSLLATFDVKLQIKLSSQF